MGFDPGTLSENLLLSSLDTAENLSPMALCTETFLPFEFLKVSSETERQRRAGAQKE